LLVFRDGIVLNLQGLKNGCGNRLVSDVLQGPGSLKGLDIP
jgi:hypothetical protein